MYVYVFHVIGFDITASVLPSTHIHMFLVLSLLLPDLLVGQPEGWRCGESTYLRFSLLWKSSVVLNLLDLTSCAQHKPPLSKHVQSDPEMLDSFYFKQSHKTRFEFTCGINPCSMLVCRTSDKGFPRVQRCIASRMLVMRDFAAECL